MKVLYLGPKGTFSHMAATNLFPSEELIAVNSIFGIFEMLNSEKADLGVVPVENSTEGSIRETLDLLTTSNLKIKAEKQIKIEHCLLVKSKNEEIKEIVSHPQALAQCRNFLHSNFPNVKIKEVESTAKAAEIVANENGKAAIASEAAASFYHLHILAHKIQDYQNNYTRFFIISKPETKLNLNSNIYKTSIVFSLKNQPAALYNALHCFAKRKINLTKIESRPSKTSLWEYIFFLDFEGKDSDKLQKEALEELKENSTYLQILGSYPVIL